MRGVGWTSGLRSVISLLRVCSGCLWPGSRFIVSGVFGVLHLTRGERSRQMATGEMERRNRGEEKARLRCNGVRMRTPDTTYMTLYVSSSRLPECVGMQMRLARVSKPNLDCQYISCERLLLLLNTVHTHLCFFAKTQACYSHVCSCLPFDITSSPADALPLSARNIFKPRIVV
jgi:hypothetical protein